jgi:hypothetical protein
MSGMADDDVADDVEVRPMTPADTQGVSDLIVRCYGDAYPKRVMYRPDELARLVRSRAYNGVVATTGAAVVGHIGYTWPTRAASVVEAGTTVVDPRCRGKGLMGRLAIAMAELLASEGAVGFTHFPTTAHPVMQRASLGAGGRETGIMLAYLPPDTRDLTIAALGEQRLAVTVVYQPVLESSAQSVYLPRRYAGQILGIADALGLRRSAARPFRTPTGESQLDRALDPSRGLERIAVDHIGADIAITVASVVASTPAGLVHVDLPMNDPGIDHAVEQLRSSSFAFAAWLPGWAGHDVLRLQHVAGWSEAELSPTLFSPEAEALMAVIRAELLGLGPD